MNSSWDGRHQEKILMLAVGGGALCCVRRGVEGGQVNVVQVAPMNVL